MVNARRNKNGGFNIMHNPNAKEKIVETGKVKKHNCGCMSAEYKPETGVNFWGIKTYCTTHKPNFSKKADRIIRRNASYHKKQNINEMEMRKRVQKRRLHAKKTK